jgi:hypothetical protein
MAPKTTYVVSFLVNIGGAPELPRKLIISNTAIVFKTVKFEWKNTFLCDVAFNFLDIATLFGTCMTA